MTRLNRHLVPTVLVAGALAVGIALGAGPLGEERTSSHGGVAVAADPAVVRQAAMGDEFALAAAPELLPGRLTGHRVALVLLPGASEEDATALRRHVTMAGGRVTSTVTVDPQLLDPTRAAYVDALTDRIASRLGSRVDADAPTYERAAQVLGASVAAPVMTDRARTAQERTAAKALDQGGLASATGQADVLADLVLVLGGDDVAPETLGELVAGLDRTSRGLVVASRSVGSPGDEGRPVAVLRSLRTQGGLGAGVATVDGTETRIGRIAATLTLVRQITPAGGDYGASGIDGIAPLG